VYMTVLIFDWKKFIILPQRGKIKLYG